MDIVSLLHQALLKHPLADPVCLLNDYRYNESVKRMGRETNHSLLTEEGLSGGAVCGFAVKL